MYVIFYEEICYMNMFMICPLKVFTKYKYSDEHWHNYITNCMESRYKEIGEQI